jgi:hypothetical protein
MPTSNKVVFDRTEAGQGPLALKGVWDYSDCFLLLGLLLTCAELISFARKQTATTEQGRSVNDSQCILEE